MIDRIHITITDPISVRKIHDKLCFRPFGDLEKNVPAYPWNKEHYGLTFKYIRTRLGDFKIDIEGSLHRFYNICFHQSNHTYDDFGYEKLKRALHALEEVSACKLRYMHLMSFEFGVNVRCGEPPNHLIHKARLFDKCIPSITKTYPNKGLMKIFERTDYFVKIYNKSARGKLNKISGLNHIDDLIRYEIKFTRSRQGKHVAGILTMADFKSKQKFIKLANILQTNWQKILMEDTLDYPGYMTDKEKDIFQKAVRTDYFYDPLHVNFTGRRRTDQRARFYNRYINILDTYGLRSAHQKIGCLLKQKCDELVIEEHRA